MSERHDFSVMIIAAGNLIHYDQSLMELYMTPLLKGVRDWYIRVPGILMILFSVFKSSAVLMMLNSWQI